MTIIMYTGAIKVYIIQLYLTLFGFASKMYKNNVHFTIIFYTMAWIRLIRMGVLRYSNHNLQVAFLFGKE